MSLTNVAYKMSVFCETFPRYFCFILRKLKYVVSNFLFQLRRNNFNVYASIHQIELFIIDAIPTNTLFQVKKRTR